MEYRHTEVEVGAGAAAADASMSGHDHGTADGDCKISMLLNFHTVGACFFSEGWKITSVGMFAGSCIGVVLLCFLLEFLRRGVKEFDKFLVKQHIAQHTATSVTPVSPTDESEPKAGLPSGSYPPFRPNVWQQAARAVLHTTQFTVAYFIMLIAMYYNVYFLVCIFLSILTASFIFQWEPLSSGKTSDRSKDDDPTVCCG